MKRCHPDSSNSDQNQETQSKQMRADTAVVFEEIDDDGADMSMRGGRGGPRFGTSMNLNTSSNVFIYSEGKASKKEVKLGISNDELQEILSGISEGDEIIIGPPRILAKLKDGDSVNKFNRRNKNAS